MPNRAPWADEADVESGQTSTYVKGRGHPGFRPDGWADLSDSVPEAHETDDPSHADAESLGDSSDHESIVAHSVIPVAAGIMAMICGKKPP